jgi:acyl dehydratase
MDSRIARFAEDFRVGEEFELGSYLVTRDELVDFARKYDPFPFHVDEEAARSTPFGESSPVAG